MTSTMEHQTPLVRRSGVHESRGSMAPPSAPGTSTGISRSRAVVTGAATALEPISLAHVTRVAGLQTRTDNKYLLTPEQFAELMDNIPTSTRVLDIDDRRVFSYESMYFDTEDLALFRAHRQRRRRRFKVRTRSYVDTGGTTFEVKLKGYREQTVKHRTPHDFERRRELTGSARSFLHNVLRDEYGVNAPALEPSLMTTYRRSTLVDSQNAARLTCDVDLWCANDHTGAAGPDLVLVESKSAGGRAPADNALKAMGIRPVSLSKYCIGTALVHPGVPANKWNRLLRHHFGWQRSWPGDDGTGSTVCNSSRRT